MTNSRASDLAVELTPQVKAYINEALAKVQNPKA
jgi:hypothetical protein